MIGLRFAVPAVLVAAVMAGCFTYLVGPPPLAGDDQRMPPTGKVPGAETAVPIVHPPGGEDKADAFLRAARAILKEVPNAQASADTDQPPITGHIPLPKKRPIPRL